MTIKIRDLLNVVSEANTDRLLLREIMSEMVANGTVKQDWLRSKMLEWGKANGVHKEILDYWHSYRNGGR